MTDRVKACPGKELKQMSTEQLDVLLQTELKKELPDEAIVMPILQELQEREKDYPVKAPKGLAENMAGYRDKIHTVPEMPKRKVKKTLRIAAVAAVLCIVFMAIPRTVGAESVFQVLFRWTESFFEFLRPGDNKENLPVEYVFKTDNEGLQKLYDTLVAEGVTDPVVPMWLPDGCKLTEIKVENILAGNKVSALFVEEDTWLLLTYNIDGDEVSTQYEKRDTMTELYEINGVEHYIAENKESISAIWMQKRAECLLSTNLDCATVRKIIASIYRRE